MCVSLYISLIMYLSGSYLSLYLCVYMYMCVNIYVCLLRRKGNLKNQLTNQLTVEDNHLQ